MSSSDSNEGVREGRGEMDRGGDWDSKMGREVGMMRERGEGRDGKREREGVEGDNTPQYDISHIRVTPLSCANNTITTTQYTHSVICVCVSSKEI